jgi:arabinogalactan oligomer/maltooligosaccharide transport system substrate-binding protein
MFRVVRPVAALAAATMVAGGVIAAAPIAQAADPITVWADAAHAPIIQNLLPKGYQGVPVNVITKDLATMRADLAAATAATAPDVIWGDLAWTGELAAAKSIVPVVLTKKRATKFRANVLGGSQVGADRYGAPVQISNLALVTNTTLVPKQPTTFSALVSTALALKKDKKVKVPFALPQGEGSNPYTTFPLFNGIGGYLFGKAAAGGLDPKDVGLASKKLLKNSEQIDAWNKAGVLDSTLSADAAFTAFSKGKSAFWLAGPEDLARLLGLTFVYRIGSVPPVIATRKSAPLLTIHGFMVTRFAQKHGLAEAASGLVARFMTKPGPQLALANASGWFPANTTAAQKVPTGGGRIRAIGNAGADGVPMPNIPQAGSVWGPYGTAWSVSTSGTAATPAKDAFRIAEDAAVAAIG